MSSCHPVEKHFVKVYSSKMQLQQVCIKRLYGKAFTKWLDTGRLPKMAVTTNCKQFFFLNQQSYSTYNKNTNHLK